MGFIGRYVISQLPGAALEQPSHTIRGGGGELHMPPSKALVVEVQPTHLEGFH